MNIGAIYCFLNLKNKIKNVYQNFYFLDGIQLIKLASDKLSPSSLSEDPSFLYHIDKHDGFTSHALGLGNIAALLENNPNSYFEFF